MKHFSGFQKFCELHKRKLHMNKYEIHCGCEKTQWRTFDQKFIAAYLATGGESSGCLGIKRPFGEQQDRRRSIKSIQEAR